MTPQSARQLADDLRAGNQVTPTRGPGRLATWREAARILAGFNDDQATPDGQVSLEHDECNAACEYAPVVMVNWEIFDNMTPASARQLVDDLRAGHNVAPTRGPGRLVTWREASRILAGFNDDLAAEGPAAGPADLVGLKIAKERGWAAPEPGSAGDQAKEPR